MRGNGPGGAAYCPESDVVRKMAQGESVSSAVGALLYMLNTVDLCMEERTAVRIRHGLWDIMIYSVLVPVFISQALRS